ncbi:MAG TPA: hypothetical protein DGG95_08825 [Cytophagales bacterium]|jgi:FKBP-type peptidyl-prolyl cis-trans isomerase FkpA|nr:hypothetical protein [Cytophagales bacterium]
MKSSLKLFGLLSLISFSCINDNVFNPKAQFKSDTIAIHAFLKTNNISATKVVGGAWYIIDSLAVGIYPVLSDSIKVAYTAQIINHDFSLTKITSDTVTVLLSSVMAGWQNTVPLITTGSKGRLFIPSGLAYGQLPYTVNNMTIPGNSNLAYDFHLINSKGTHLYADTTVIGSYLSQEGILPIVDRSGIRYTIDTVGTGSIPSATDSIIATFKGNILKADSLFVKDTIATKLSLKNQIPAWRIILPKLKEGSYVKMYVPSGYGYGSSSPSAKIPANSNLEYRIKLIKVIH